MATHAADVQSILFEGEIVEILDDGGRRLAKVKVGTPLVVVLPESVLADAHLGDRLVVTGWIAGIDSPTQEST